jgi:Protein of unknown function (DUF1553)/Protein of unknown function (DUF1549)/Planctomycete cytochrome C/Concanavalin A-like lectin/glucanases superfamily
MRLLSLLLLFAMTSATPAAVDFGRDVLPILSENCFHCHGPDDKGRKAGLRLDTQEGAFKKRKSKAMLVPGKSHESEVIARILSDDSDLVMPPPDSNRKLSAKQKAILKQWVDEGARWGQHWAFLPPDAKLVNGPFTTPNPIDHFVRQKLAKEGLKPAAPAEKTTLARRVAFDLTGLPADPNVLQAFLGDNSPNAYERYVNALLASPRYGERMAAEWLDIARYADTHGYQSDRARAMWAYRDWVINAFNANLPFDKFIAWQLAGDLLPNATKEQRLATAFNRLHMQNEEGGIVEEEFRVAYVVDRVNTFGTAFLGMTFECTRCHDHKYDPLTMKDFYSLFSFFQNIDESGQTSYFTPSMPVPTLLLTTDDQDRQIALLQENVRLAEGQLRGVRDRAKADFDAWRPRRPGIDGVRNLVAHYPFDPLPVNLAQPRLAARGHENPKAIPGKSGQGVALNGENGIVFPGVGHVSRVDPFTVSIWLKPTKKSPRAVVLHHSVAPVDAGSRGYELLLEDEKVAFGLHHMWPGNSLKVRTKRAVDLNRWTHVTVTYDGSSRADGVKLFLDGQPAGCDVVRDGLTKDITYGNEPDLAIGYRFRDNGFQGGEVDELKLHDRAVSEIEAAILAGRPLPAPTDGQLFEHYLAAHHEPSRQSRIDLRAARAAYNAAVNPIPEAMVMREMPTPKPAFILKRGAYDAPGDPVSAETPAILPKFPATLPRNRLGLAQWLTDPAHPLTCRVTVNRLWQMMFGKGIVETSDNFGTTGSVPTHPELLDWLAQEFIRQKWDAKTLLKTIAMSETYRQSSRTTPELLANDPENQLLARAPARRLAAEMLRDQALAVSGLLVEKQGGPSVYPYQPDGLWNEAMGRPNYPRSKGADLYRRGLYTFWKRTAPPPTMVTFDAADRSVCNARRQSTSTPLQALALLNDPQIVEAARFLGQRTLLEGGTTPEARIGWMFRTTTGRAASEKELAVLKSIWADQRAAFQADAKATDKLLSVGDAKSDPKLDKTDLAAATVTALAVLNHDEAVHRR